jgi:hypothetical protein
MLKYPGYYLDHKGVYVTGGDFEVEYDKFKELMMTSKKKLSLE